MNRQIASGGFSMCDRAAGGVEAVWLGEKGDVWLGGTSKNFVGWRLQKVLVKVAFLQPL